jgi:2-polyprenyl-3-methyl-5-hydroxy-6-metoxy-1,4-benzoquinol methylase
MIKKPEAVEVGLKIAGGMKEDSIVIGNAYDKYGSKNPIVKWMMHGFESALSSFISQASPLSIYEVGCGEGYWVLQWRQKGLQASGCDFSKQVIAIAQENAANLGITESIFNTRSIYDLEESKDGADLVVCCEVLEHLEDPHTGLKALQRIVGRNLIVSVPREPIWRVLNLARGKYLTRWGNTPGHIQHWSKTEFINLVSKYFEVVEVKNPLPWTMLLCRPL